MRQPCYKNRPALKEKYTGAVTNILRHRLGMEDDPGSSLFQLSPPDPANPGAPQQIMGVYTPGDNPHIRVFSGHDYTTVMHELGHHAWQMRRSLALDDLANVGLYDPDQFNTGNIMNIDCHYGGDEHYLRGKDYRDVLSYSIAYRANFGWQLLDARRTVGAVTNIDKDHAPSIDQIDEMLASCFKPRFAQATWWIVNYQSRSRRIAMSEIYQKINGVRTRLKFGLSVLPIRADVIHEDGQLFMEQAEASDMVFTINNEGYLEVEYVQAGGWQNFARQGGSF